MHYTRTHMKFFPRNFISPCVPECPFVVGVRSDVYVPFCGVLCSEMPGFNTVYLVFKFSYNVVLELGASSYSILLISNRFAQANNLSWILSSSVPFNMELLPPLP